MLYTKWVIHCLTNLLDDDFNAAYTLVFNNGCRAPFWRQLNGDIGYIVAKPHNAEPIYITAGTNGYFVNGVSVFNTAKNILIISNL